MPRTLYCRACQGFVDSTGLSWSDAMVLHLLTSTVQHPAEIDCYSVESILEDLAESLRAS
jgi:hypothetical protein